MRKDAPTMQRFSMLARHVISLVALAIALMTFGTASMVTSTSAAPAGAKSSVVAANSDGRMKSTVAGETEDGQQVRAGKFTPESFDVEDGAMTVTGTLTGVIPGEGRFSETVTTTVEEINGTPVNGDAGAMRLASHQNCDILNLVLGPLDLNLLGLEVHLDTVVLDIIAVPGPGNLLGNLLCAVAHLLDDGGPLSNLLNRILGVLEDILGGLGLGGL